MAGTQAGGRKAQATIAAKIGPEAAHQWRVEIGAKGGRISRGGMFSKDRDFASRMGRIGGSVSRPPRASEG